VIGRGHHHGVERGLRQQVVVVHIALGIGRRLQAGLQVGFEDIGHRHALGAELVEVLLEVPAAPAGADQTV